MDFVMLYAAVPYNCAYFTHCQHLLHRETSTSALLTMLKLLNVWITANWKIRKEIGVRDHLTCLPRNLYAGQEATVRTGYTTDWFKSESRLYIVNLLI